MRRCCSVDQYVAAKAGTRKPNTVQTLFNLKNRSGKVAYAGTTFWLELALKRQMLSQCANSSCGRPLTSLSEGRLYQFEIVSISISATDDDPEKLDETPHRETAHFWLCGACAKTMTLALEPLSGLRLLPIQPNAPQTCAPSSFPELQDS